MKGNIEKIVKRYEAQIEDTKIFFHPNIPPKKLSNALDSYAEGLKEEDVLVLIDNTVFGKAKNGALLTSKVLYSHNTGEEPQYIELNKIKTIKLKEGFGNDIYINGLKFLETTMPIRESIRRITEMLRKISGYKDTSSRETSQKRKKDDVERLIESLEDEDSTVREKAAKALGKRKDKRAVKPLIRAMYDKRNNPLKNEVCEYAIQSLAMIKDKEAADILIHDLKNKDKEIRNQAGYTLGRLGDERALEPLIQALNDEDKEVRNDISEGFVFFAEEIGDPAIKRLIKALKDDNWRLRQHAAWILGNTEDKRAVEPLIQALKDENSDVRMQAAWALGDFNDKRAVEPLVQALHDENKEVREAVTEALDRIKIKREPAKARKTKPKVEKIILFWLDNIPEITEAQSIADLLPQKMHPELIFESNRAFNDKISSKSVLKLMNKHVTTVALRLSQAIISEGGHIKDVDKNDFEEVAETRSMHIAVMQIIENELGKKYGIKRAAYPDKLICKFIETTAGPCYYTLLLDSEIDPSKYDFATGKGGAKLSTIFWEADNT